VLTYLLRRLALMVPTLVGMTLLLFVVIRLSPGVASGTAFGAGGEMKGGVDRTEQILKVKRRLGMVDAQGRDVPVWRQYFVWLGQTFPGRWVSLPPILGVQLRLPWVGLDLGESTRYRKPVTELIAERAPVTIVLNLLATFAVYLIAIPGGMLSSVRRGKGFDVFWSFATLALYSLPVIWIGSMAIGFLANPAYLAAFPAAGLHATDTSRMTFLEYQLDYLRHLVLPVLVMTYAGFAYLSKLMRASMLENSALDYARTARAKGLGEFAVQTRHVLRNSLLAQITIATSIIPGLLGGSVIVEQLFSIKGMGQLGYEATFARDLPVIQALGLVSAALVLAANLLTDLLYMVADPRVSYD
jgi:ABC-type dipeptide/oligopeptide/nickel transport system permease component